MEKLNFKQISKQACLAYENATKTKFAEYVKNGPAFSVGNYFTDKVEGLLFDVCGIVFLEITDKRSAFYKQLKQYCEKSGYNGVDIQYKSGKFAGRQEYGLQIAGCLAAKDVLEKYGAKVKLHATVD